MKAAEEQGQMRGEVMSALVLAISSVPELSCGSVRGTEPQGPAPSSGPGGRNRQEAVLTCKRVNLKTLAPETMAS